MSLQPSHSDTNCNVSQNKGLESQTVHAESHVPFIASLNKNNYQNLRNILINHINVRSVKSKLHRIKIIVKDDLIGILCLPENWLKYDISNTIIQIEGCNVYKKYS